MGSDVAELLQVLQNSSGVKVHSSMCWELIKILDKVVDVLPAIESARPGGRSGIQALCCLTNAIEKAKLILKHCAESSKLYLAITGDSILLRCERIKSALNESLSQIEEIVPSFLASQIAEILNYVRDAKFTIDSIEGEAGKVMLQLLGQTDSTKVLELEAFEIAASRLNVTSNKALLIERRSIKKLLDDVRSTDSKKEKILKYLLYLLKAYGKQVVTDISMHKENVNPSSAYRISSTTFACEGSNSGNNNESIDQDDTHTYSCTTDAPPEEFLCPISSKVMYDPVVIASGHTYERIWIEKWFNEGNGTCPKTKEKLENFSIVPNSCMKDLISNWCREHGVSIHNAFSQPKPAEFSSWEFSTNDNSISSLKNVPALLLNGRTDYILQSDHSYVSFVSSDATNFADSSHVRGIESLEDDSACVFSWSDDYQKYHAFSNFSQDMYLKFFSQLSELPLKAQDKAAEEVKLFIENDEETCHAMLSNGFIEALMTFLKKAYSLSDVQAQKIGVQILLAFVNKIRVEIEALGDDGFQLLTFLLESEVALEALMIMQMLFRHTSCVPHIVASSSLPSIIKFLDFEGTEFLEVAVKILCDISSQNEIRPQILSCGGISKLVPLLGNRRLAESCIKIMRNLSDMEEARTVISQTNGCLASIAEILDTGNQEEQAHAAVILHSLCSHSLGNCKLVMNEGVVPSLVRISINGNPKGKESSMKLLYILRDIKYSNCFESSQSQSESNDCSGRSQS